MATIQKFEDIDAWRKARELTAEIYRTTSTGEFARDFGLRDQIRRSAVSIMSNIAEGFERGGNREFQQFLAIAKGSAGEVRAQLYVAVDAGFLREEEFQRLSMLALEVSRLIKGLMRYLANADLKGNRFVGS